ncbi:MAG: hypothetical protein E6J34_02395 [Chloroflexi bacterium]|nr:MAG: hypothetical protein E6J34_02395 [Chloroflexota bacterium]
MQKCQNCNSEVQAPHSFCGYCGASVDIQQQAMSTLSTALTPGDQSDGRKVEEKKSDSAYLRGLTPPKDEQMVTPQTPSPGVGQIAYPGAAQTPGLGAGQIAYPGAAQTPGLGAGQIAYPGAAQAPGLGAGQSPYSGIPQAPSSGLSQGVHPGMAQAPGLGMGQSPYSGIPQAPSSGLSHPAGSARKATSTIRKWVTTAITTVAIVAVGTAAVLMNTHNNVPAANATFQVKISVQGQYDANHGPFVNNNTLTVTEGKVCSPEANGQVQHITGPTTNGQSYTEDAKLSCTGTYQGGEITYIETYISAVFSLTDQGNKYTCQLLKPGPRQKLSGHYTTQGNFSGTITVNAFPQSAFSCTSNINYELFGGTGTWSGTIT